DAVRRSVVLRESVCLDRCRHVPLLARRNDLNVTLRSHPAQPSACPDGDSDPGGAAERVLVEELDPAGQEPVEPIRVDGVIGPEARRVQLLSRPGRAAAKLACRSKELDPMVAATPGLGRA